MHMSVRVQLCTTLNIAYFLEIGRNRVEKHALGGSLNSTTLWVLEPPETPVSQTGLVLALIIADVTDASIIISDMIQLSILKPVDVASIVLCCWR